MIFSIIAIVIKGSPWYLFIFHRILGYHYLGALVKLARTRSTVRKQIAS